MAKKKRYEDPYSEETVRKKRSFPTGNTVLLVLLIVAQVSMLIAAIGYDPQPQDIIKEYEVTVVPQENGSLDITYRLVWQALDTSEDLTWIEIGMPNAAYTVYHNSLSPNISYAAPYEDGAYTSLQLDLDRAYRGGETLQVYFTVNQQRMLCKDAEGLFYELVPGWFNATPVEQYTFRWERPASNLYTNATTEDNDWLIWKGSMPFGTYVPMQVRYPADAFAGSTIAHVPFDDSGVTDDLADDKAAIVALAVLFALVLVIFEVYIVDSYVSYSRGRGFIRGYGYHVHTYGRVNPHYKKEQAKRSAASGRGGFSGGGCACACACACAGGGRAGCSQKDGFYIKRSAKRMLREPK